MAGPTTKVWKATRTAPAGIVLNEKSTIIIGTKDNLIGVDERGTTISGPISFATDARNIRRGGLFVGMNDFTDMIPSTVVTPLPKQIPLPPIHGVVGIARDVAFFAALLV
jgi:hypothetical protein